VHQVGDWLRLYYDARSAYRKKKVAYLAYFILTTSRIPHNLPDECKHSMLFTSNFITNHLTHAHFILIASCFLTTYPTHAHATLTAYNLHTTHPTHVHFTILHRLDCHHVEDRFTPVVFETIFRKDLKNKQILWLQSSAIWLIDWLTLRRLMSYIYGAPILDVSRSHTTTQHSR